MLNLIQSQTTIDKIETKECFNEHMHRFIVAAAKTYFKDTLNGLL